MQIRNIFRADVGIGPYAHFDGLTEKQKTLASLTVSGSPFRGALFLVQFPETFYKKPLNLAASILQLQSTSYIINVQILGVV